MPKTIRHICIVYSFNWLEEKLSFTTNFCNKKMSFEITFQLQLTFFGCQICLLQWWEKCEIMFSYYWFSDSPNFEHYWITNWNIIFFPLAKILINLRRCCLHIENLKKLIFVNKNWPNGPKIGCRSPSN
jgi:hypothetical protein